MGRLPKDPLRVDDKTAGHWLKDLREGLPAGHKVGRSEAVAATEVSYRTIMDMENGKKLPDGLTVLRYLKLLGVLPDAPVALPALGRLAELEAKVERMDKALAEGFDRLGGAIAQLEERLPPQDRKAQSS